MVLCYHYLTIAIIYMYMCKTLKLELLLWATSSTKKWAISIYQWPIHTVTCNRVCLDYHSPLSGRRCRLLNY